MFKRIRRKLAAATRRKSRRAEVYAVPKPCLDSGSDGSPSPRDSRKPLLSEEVHSPQGPKLAAKRGADVNGLAKSEDVSQLKPDRDKYWSHDVEDYPRSRVTTQVSKRQESPTKAQSHLCELEDEDFSESGAMKFITIPKPGKKVQALFITPITYQRTQALVHARQDLRAAESELAITTAELDNLIAAKNELEEQDCRDVPGAFVDDDAYADRERRGLLISTIERKINFCRQTLEHSGSQRPPLEADLEALQEQFFDDLERAVRDHMAANTSVPNSGGSGKAAVWRTE